MLFGDGCRLFNQRHFVDITRTVREHFPQFYPQHHFRLCPVSHSRIIVLYESAAVHVDAGLPLEVDEQQADMRVHQYIASDRYMPLPS